ncbi:MAG: pyridoxal-phosphate dependent enzyme [Candidatus Izemoplasmatales bacterium]|nr:pyridoxal-phosphate dependent enzyme [Candidatus Izemoplasmatales bacterium]MDD4069822.1 pyridoxal-phosphate dependent enzyme [Candidatus Izemoplasmatales bacterium]
MKNIGKTPLLRAVNIEKALGVKKIYLKLEGNNPTGSKADRIANVILKAVKARGKEALVINGDKNLLKSLKHCSTIENIMLFVPKEKKESWKEKLLESSQLVDMSGVKAKDKEELLISLAARTNAFLVTPADYIQFSIIANETIAQEIYQRYPGDIDNYFYNNDSIETLQAYQNIFLKAHLENSSKIPEIIGADENETVTLNNQYVSVEKDLLDEASNLLQKQEHLKVKYKDVVAFAGFLKQHKLGRILEGRHIIVLDQARSRVKIREIKDYSEIDKEKLLSYVNNYLGDYRDSKEEALEAIEMAMKDGYVLVASKEEKIDGVCIVVDLKIKRFIPRYHLAYIGINKDSKGRGIGTELIKEAVNLTNGNISLHVDLDNKSAKKLYKKMGFVHVYDRMIYKK